jgi:hypothetical protein
MRYSSESKGRGPVSAKYACGGEVITTRSRFLKTKDQFRNDTGVDQDYDKKGKGGTLSKLEGETKKLPAVKPQR